MVPTWQSACHTWAKPESYILRLVLTQVKAAVVNMPAKHARLLISGAQCRAIWGGNSHIRIRCREVLSCGIGQGRKQTYWIWTALNGS